MKIILIVIAFFPYFQVLSQKSLFELYWKEAYKNYSSSNLNDAEKYSKLAGQEALKIQNDTLILSAYELLSIIQTKMGKYDEAEYAIVQELDIFQKIHGKNGEGIASIYNNLANVNHLLNRNFQAEFFYKKSIESLLSQDKIDSLRYAGTLNGYGALLIDLKKFEDAKEMFSASFNLYYELLQKQRSNKIESDMLITDFINLMRNYAILYEQLDDKYNANKYYHEALDICNKTIGWDHYMTIDIMKSYIKFKNID